jgi:hypothetical protein
MLRITWWDMEWSIKDTIGDLARGHIVFYICFTTVLREIESGVGFILVSTK